MDTQRLHKHALNAAKFHPIRGCIVDALELIRLIDEHAAMSKLLDRIGDWDVESWQQERGGLPFDVGIDLVSVSNYVTGNYPEIPDSCLVEGI